MVWFEPVAHPTEQAGVGSSTQHYFLQAGWSAGRGCALGGSCL